MQRVTTTDIPYILSFHTSAREFLKSSLVSGLSRVSDRTLVLNYADYVIACSNMDIYGCCLAGYTPRDFVESRYFMENLIRGSFSADYYQSFLKTLKLYGVEIAALVGYLRYLEKDLGEGHFKVIPTLPEALITRLNSQDNLIHIETYTREELPQVSDWLEVIGWVAINFAFTGDIDWFKYIGPASYNSDMYSAYIFDLLKSLSKPSLDKFILYEEEVS